jgi:Na+/H+ antiporter NhaD/arsenite permease-like protein
MTYIGNAPNFMVRSIAKQSGVEMPSFMGYIVWSSLVLLPILYILSLYQSDLIKMVMIQHS